MILLEVASVGSEWVPVGWSAIVLGAFAVIKAWIPYFQTKANITNIEKEKVSLVEGHKKEKRRLEEKIINQNETIIRQNKKIEALTKELTESINNLSKVEGWFFAMKDLLEKYGVTNVLELINKVKEENEANS